MRFWVNESSAPTPLRAHALAIAKAAAEAWNRIWPMQSPAGECALICVVGSTRLGMAQDGVNTISWGSPSDCGGAFQDSIAVACYVDESAAPNGSTRIEEVDIVLSSTRRWAWPQDVPEVARGSVRSLYPGAILDVDWYDAQSVLTHEIGHAFGLEDIGNAHWPSDFRDAAMFSQVMYAWVTRGATDKRLPQEGDFANMTLDAQATVLDP